MGVKSLCSEDLTEGQIGQSRAARSAGTADGRPAGNRTAELQIGGLLGSGWGQYASPAVGGDKAKCTQKNSVLLFAALPNRCTWPAARVQRPLKL